MGGERWKTSISSHLIGVVKLIPHQITANILLAFPSLYRTRLVKYESYISSDAAEQIKRCIAQTRGIDGNIIEFGSARCGTTVVIGNYLRANGIRKNVYACDVFGEGRIREELREEGGMGRVTPRESTAFTYNSLEYVQKKVERLGLAETIILVKGRFEDTLGQIDSNFSLAFIDCDLGKSTSYCMRAIWPRLSSGGVMLIHDYGASNLRSLKLAVDSFVDEHRSELLEHGLREMYFIQKI